MSSIMAGLTRSVCVVNAQVSGGEVTARLDSSSISEILFT
jgi:hypothetical protein